MKTHAERSTK